MEYIKNNGDLWVLNKQIWSVFETKYGYNYMEIRELITHLVWKHLKLKDVTPLTHLHLQDSLVWKHLKLKDVTPFENQLYL